MKDKFRIIHEFMLLFVNLSQLKDRDQIIELFINAINQQDIGLELSYLSTQQCEDSQVIPIKTQDNLFGCFKIKGKLSDADAEFMSVIRNFVNMLAVILENLLQAELLAKASEQRFKDLFYNAPVAYQSLDANGCYLEVNKIWLEIMGYEKNEVIGKWFGDFISKDQHAIFAERFPCFKSLGMVCGVEFNMLRKDGTTFLASFEGRISYDEKGDFKQTHCIFTDITEKKEKESNLLAAEQRLRSVVDASPFPVALVDELDYKIFYWSDSAIKLFGHTAPTAEQWYLLAYPDDDYRRDVIARWKPVVDKAKKTGKTLNAGEYRVTCKDGLVKICEIYVRFIPGYLAVTFNDITMRKESEAQNIKQKYYLSRAQEIGIIGSWEHDLIKNELAWNEQTYKIFGVPQGKKMTLVDFVNIVHPEDREYVQNQWNDAVFNKKPYDIDHRIIANGKVLWVREKAELEFDKTGQCIKGTGFVQDITEKKYTEEIIKDSELKFRVLAETSKDMIYRMQIPSEKYDYVSPAAAEIFGYTSEEFYSNPGWIKEAIHPEWIDYFQKEWDRLLKGQVSPTYEYQIIDNKGNVKWLNQRNSLIKDEQSNPIAIQGIVTDITEKKESENNLIKAKEKAERIAIELNKVQQITHVGSWYIDLGTNQVVWTEELYKMYGFDPALPPPPYTEHMKLFTPESWEILSTALARTAETGIPYELELKTVRKDKSNGWLWCRGEAVFDQNNKIIGLWGAAQDITQTKKMQIAILDEKQLNEEYINSLPGLFYVFDEKNFIQWNINWEQITGYNHDELSKMYGTDFFEGEDKLRIEKHMKEVFSQGHTEVEAELVLKNGKKIPYYFTGLRKNIKGNDYLIGLGLNITERKKAEEELKKIEWMLSGKPLLENSVKDQGYGDLTALNQGGLIASSIDKATLRDIVAEYLNLLETSSAIYEKNGDYAYGIFCSGWCQMMDSASRKLCDTQDNAAALASGKWLCHESCWTDCSKQAIESKAPVDIECAGGINLYAVPIFSAGEVIGAINFGYGEPPRDAARLKELADDYGLDAEKLTQEAVAYAARPAYIIELSKKRLLSSSRLIGLMVEQKKIEIELAESAERFKALHNASFGGIAIHDNGVILECNQGLSELTGYSPDEIIGMDGLLLVAPEDREIVMNNIRIGYEKPYEVTGLRKNGERYLIRLEGRNIPYKGKSVRTVEFRDITEQKKAEKIILESEKEYRSTVEGLLVGVVVHDANGNILLSNSASARILGLTEDQMPGKKLIDPEWKFVYEDLSPVKVEDYPVSKVISTKKPLINYVLGVVRPKREYITWININAMPISSEAGDLEKVIVNFQDITVNRNAELQIKSLAKFPEENPSPVMRFKKDGTLIYANDGAQKLVDLWGSKNGLCQDEQINNIVSKAYSSGKIQIEEVKIKDKAYSLTFAPVVEGEYVNVYGLDITARKLFQQALEKRIVAMSQPLDESANIDFDALFNLKEIQELQDLFAKSANVASMITAPDGTPITRSSNFCRLCNDIIRKTEKGAKNCACSDAAIGKSSTTGPKIQTCLSAGLWDAGASIIVGGKHIANWLVGQVRNEEQNEEKVKQYAREIGADEQEFVKAFNEVPVMSKQQFQNVADTLFAMANLLSSAAYQNVQQARFIAQRQKAENDLLSSNQRFQELFDNMSSGVAIYQAVDDSADFIFQDFNKSAEKIENISKDQVLGKRVTEVFPGVQDFGLLSVFQRVWQTGKPENFSDKIYQDKRIVGWRRNYVFKIPTGEIIAVYDDVTEQKKIEKQEKEIFAAQAAAQVEKQKAAELGAAYQELKLMQSQLLQAEKMASIGQLGAGVAHELNSPLAGILSLLRSYKKEKDQSSEEYDDLNEMEKACEHMAKIIKSLNSFSRQSTGEKEDVDCNQTIKSILSFMAYQLEKKSIIIETDLAKDLAMISANENQIQQIVVNMVTNASDALSTQGKFKITTKNLKIADKAYVEMLFEDNGCGIKSEDIKKIFDPFFTTKRPGGGVGLGLSIVYKIVENHKGTVSVDSKEGQGTVFNFRFPVS